MNVHTTGAGRPLLLMHGGGEDADMMAASASAFARRGYRVISYDRRGTGASPRDGWPESGLDGHVADAVRILRDHDAVPARVVGFSSGGVVALALAVRHPELVETVWAWEPAALGMVPGGLDLHAQLSAPADAHLAAHPGDWRGAALILLAAMSGGAADPASAFLRNAEALVRDDGAVITRAAFAPEELPASVRVAVGKNASPLHAGIAEALGRPVLVVDDADEHEIYLTRPDVLAAALA